MAEAREAIEHKVPVDIVRKRVNEAVDEYKKRYPSYQIEAAWRSPTRNEFSLKLTPMTKLHGSLVLDPGYVLISVTYPDILKSFGGDRIGMYTASLREEVQRRLWGETP